MFKEYLKTRHSFTNMNKNLYKKFKKATRKLSLKKVIGLECDNDSYGKYVGGDDTCSWVCCKYSDDRFLILHNPEDKIHNNIFSMYHELGHIANKDFDNEHTEIIRCILFLTLGFYLFILMSDILYTDISKILYRNVSRILFISLCLVLWEFMCFKVYTWDYARRMKNKELNADSFACKYISEVNKKDQIECFRKYAEMYGDLEYKYHPSNKRRIKNIN